MAGDIVVTAVPPSIFSYADQRSARTDPRGAFAKQLTIFDNDIRGLTPNGTLTTAVGKRLYNLLTGTTTASRYDQHSKAPFTELAAAWAATGSSST